MSTGTDRTYRFMILVSVIALLFSAACNALQSQTNPPSSNNAAEQIPVTYTEKGDPKLHWNPKLSSALNQLFEADKAGETEAFVRGGNIQLVNGKVRVVIYAVSGQIKAAIAATEKAGAELLRVGRLGEETKDWLTAFVPIGGLEALANDISVGFIELPGRPTLP